MFMGHQNMFTICQEMIEFHQEISDDFPAVSCENSQKNVVLHEETIGIRREIVGIRR